MEGYALERSLILLTTNQQESNFAYPQSVVCAEEKLIHQLPINETDREKAQETATYLICLSHQLATLQRHLTFAAKHHFHSI